MPTVFTNHPSPEQLIAFGQGRLDVETSEVIADHVSACDPCCETLGAVPSDTLADNLLADGSDTTIDTSHSRAAESDESIPTDLINHPRYRIARVLGSGGMGTVFQAQHRVMDRSVALKVINRKLTTDPEIVERFRQEVRAAAKLSHPNIVTAHDAEQTGDLHFLVMEYVEGIDLARYVKRKGPLDPGLAAHIGRQAAQGLSHAAQHHMVHRDIKPQNLIITRRGRVRILDFGLARLGRKDREKAPASNDDQLRRSAADLTLAGSILGTPDYIAPEQALDSRTADIRSDIYSLGCTLYFLLTGHPPFPSGSVYSKLLAHQNESPQRLADIRPDIPQRLLKIIERMMSRDPESRFQSPPEVAKALQPIVKEWQNSGGKADTDDAPVQAEATIAATRMLHDGPDAADDQVEPSLPVKTPLFESAARAWVKPAAAAIAGVVLMIALWKLVTTPEGTPPAPPQTTSPLVAPADVTTVQTRQQEWARHLGFDGPTVVLPLSEHVDLTVKVVPPGSFREDGDPALQNVQSTGPLLFAETEITVAQFRVFVEEENYETYAERENGRGYGLVGGKYVERDGYSWQQLGDFTPEPDHPATNIAWYDATEFCTWLNRRVPEIQSQKVEWRLPDESEWEFACRSGSDAVYFWGDSAADSAKYAVTQGGPYRVDVVKSRMPNALGLYDMLGNEYEWCRNRTTPEREDRVQRGGSFMDSAADARCELRQSGAPSHPARGAFRVVASPID